VEHAGFAGEGLTNYCATAEVLACSCAVLVAGSGLFSEGYEIMLARFVYCVPISNNLKPQPVTARQCAEFAILVPYHALCGPLGLECV
jgi:hypothetical protein